MKEKFSSNTLGVQLFFIFSLLASILAIYNFEINTLNLGLIILGYFIYGCLGIAVMFHRYLTHSSYKTSPVFVKLFSIFGSLAGTGSPMAWIAIHINHHLNSDKDSDPHSPHTKGWKIFLLNYQHDIHPYTKWRMRHIITDKFQQILHRYYFIFLLGWSLILFLVGGFYLAAFLHWIPVTVTVLMSNIVNYVGHKPTWLGSYRTYKLNDHSSNNWLWAIPSWGESWHNNHHRFPKNYSSGMNLLEIDISAYVIKLIKQN